MIPKPFSAFAIAAVLVVSPLAADDIKLKSGETLTGRITYEADDIVKIEIPVSASIKETKVIARADIESITKEAPDDVAFNQLQSLVPTGSMISVDSYRRMLETGPDAFLRNFPASAHKAKVEEIRATLAEELDKVERGFLKVEGEWYSPQDKVSFGELIDSRIRFVRMEGFAKGNNLASYIAAMKEYEFIEENYLGSPAFPKAVELAKQVVPNLGRQLQTLAANVDFQTAEYQRALASSTPDAQAKLIAAREREDKAIADSVAADKKAGVKWVQLNPRNKQAIEEYLKLASAELARIREYNTTTLAAQAEQLVEVDRLIAENKIDEAKAKLAAATATPGQPSDSKSKSKSKSPSKSKGGGKPGSYIAALGAKIDKKVAQAQEEEKARKAAAASEALTANLKQPDSKPDAAPSSEEEEEDPEEKPDSEEAAPKEAEIDEFAALSSKKSSAKEDSKASDAKKSKSKSKSKSKAKDESDEEEDDAPARRPAPVVEEEGGFPFWLIGAIVSVLAIVGVVAMKFLGVGGKKGEE